MRRCKWCGRFVASSTLYANGRNIPGDMCSQLLCPECAPQWEAMLRARGEPITWTLDRIEK